MPICLRFDAHVIWRAFSLAFANTGNKIAARIAIIAITTSNSISVNAFLKDDAMVSAFLKGKGMPRAAKTLRNTCVRRPDEDCVCVIHLPPQFTCSPIKPWLRAD